MLSKTTFIPMQQAHVEAVAELDKRTNRAPWSVKSFEAELRNHQAHYLVGIYEGRVVAFGGYWSIVDEAHITTVAVDPQHQRKGIGRMLMTSLLSRAREQGLSCATLEVRANNVAAINLYKELGFVQCAIRKGYYPNDNEDAVVMWLYDIGEQCAI